MHVRIVVLLTCHNRREKTLACLSRVYALQRMPNVFLDVILLDDGCTDGTSEAVKNAFPEVKVLKGNGSLYWNGGMRVVFGAALERGYDFYLWLNDDTLLNPNSLSLLLKTYKSIKSRTGEEAIIAGSLRDPRSGQISYGGWRRSSPWHPLKYRLVPPQFEPVACDVVNGNCVLIPHAVARDVGNLDRRFTHGMGDFDYVLRAKSAGYAVFIAPGFIGTCRRNSIAGTWRDPALPLRKRWKLMSGPKGLPFREWSVFARRYGGPFWFVFAHLPGIHLVLSSILSRVTGRLFQTNAPRERVDQVR